MLKSCQVCGTEFEARRSRAMYCSGRCQKRAQRSGRQPATQPGHQAPVQQPVGSSNAIELERTLAELDQIGRVEKIDAAAVQALRSMAQALDSDPSQAALWRQYREALRELTADDSSNSVDEALAALYTEVRDAPPS